MKKPKTLSHRRLAQITKADRSTIKKLLEANNITDEKEALALIREWQGRDKSKPGDTDPATGLSWFKASLRETTLRQRRENEEAEAVKQGKWMATETHHKILSAVMNRIEQVPGKLKSELGLNDTQVLAMRRALDEAREAAAKQVEEGKE